jgi:radical SAM-linked protein
MTDQAWNRILCSVEKPARYAGGELFATIKSNPIVRIALSYPDLYEIGMANHGIKVLYDVANRIDDVACERVFTAAPDFASRLKESGFPLCTLETRTPLSLCDCVAFNLSHELLYTNVLQILDLGGVPLRSRDRHDGDPVVIAGGEATSNPAPMSAFIDLFYIGEGEEGFAEIAGSLKDAKLKGLSREATIAALESIEGIYRHSSGRTTTRRVYRGVPLDPLHPVIPSIRITQDRGVIEVMRGCANLCKFCHAGYTMLPCRHFDYKEAAQRARDLVMSTGYDEITFLSLSTSDYRGIIPLLNEILPEFNAKGVSLSLPSLKVDMRTLPIIEAVSNVRKSSITFAVEAASDEIRARVHKKLSIEELMEIIGTVFDGKWEMVKLYFMIGLPGFREYDEASAIVDLLLRIDDRGHRRKKINVTVSPFIPKPHTPFEREEIADERYIRDTIERIKRNLPRRITVKNHSIEGSVLEGLLARGDEAVSDAIESAYFKGAILDSWEEHVRYDIWRSTIDDTIGDVSKYYAARDDDEPLPWGRVLSGYEPLVRAMKSRVSDGKAGNRPYPEALDTARIAEGFERLKTRYEVKCRARITIEKTGRSRFISHLDFIECVKRGLRIIGFPVSFSQGFNKHERIGAGFPIPLGIESVAETIDVDMYDAFTFDPSCDQSLFFPEGIRIRTMRLLDGKESVMSESAALSFDVFCADRMRDCMKDRITHGGALLKKGKDGVMREIPMSDAVLSWSDNGHLSLVLPAGGGVRIDALIAQLSGEDDAPAKCRVVKTAQLSRGSDGKLTVIG